MHEFKDFPDSKLLDATASRPDAFAAFYRRHESMVLAYLRRRTPGAETAADLAAETFASALENAALYDASRSSDSAVSWLLTIARNTLISSIRKGRVEEQARRNLEMDRSLTIDAQVLEAIDEVASSDPSLLPAVRSLPEDEREAVLARIVEEKNYAEIASSLSCSELVVRKRVSRGLTRLRSKLSATGSPEL